jgi:hypothetical protein
MATVVLEGGSHQKPQSGSVEQVNPTAAATSVQQASLAELTQLEARWISRKVEALTL